MPTVSAVVTRVPEVGCDAEGWLADSAAVWLMPLGGDPR